MVLILIFGEVLGTLIRPCGKEVCFANTSLKVYMDSLLG